MGYHFPDARRAVFEIVGASGLSTPYLWLTTGFDAGLPATQVRRVGGSQDGHLREDRIQLDTYGAGSTAAGQAADALHELLVDRSHFVPGVGLIDSVTVETVPTELPYQSDTVNLVSATYRLASRGS